MFEYAPYRPSLPEGFTAQSTAEFHERSGRVCYELYRVYGPVEPMRGRPAVSAGRLDEGRSFWVATWGESTPRGGEHPAGRWMSFAEARARPGPRLSFAQFSSVDQMRDALPDLLRARGEPETSP